MGCCPPAIIWSFTSIQMIHTHTPRSSGADEMTMKVRWKWRWHVNYLTRTRRGERKRRGKRNTNTTHLARNGQTLKGQGKRKAEADGHGTKPAEEGEDGSAWTNLPQRNLRLPQHAQNPTYLKRGERRNTWKRDPWGTSWWHDASTLSCKVPWLRLKGPSSSHPYRRLT